MSFKRNLLLEQGTDYSNTIAIHDIRGNPTQFTSNSVGLSVMCRNYFSSNNYVFGVSLSNTFGITLTMNAETTSLLWPGTYVYDVQVTDNLGQKFRIMEGKIYVTPQVTGQSLTPS